MLRDLIPTSLDILLAELKQWFLAPPRQFAVIFDSTPNVAEAVGLVVRKVSADDNIEHRLIRLALYQASLAGIEYAAFIINAIERYPGANKADILFFNRDRASANDTAIQLLCGRFISPLATDVPCISHGLNKVGEHLQVCFLHF